MGQGLLLNDRLTLNKHIGISKLRGSIELEERGKRPSQGGGFSGPENAIHQPNYLYQPEMFLLRSVRRSLLSLLSKLLSIL